MSERVVVYQDKSFRTNFRAADPHEEESDVVENVMHLHNLTPLRHAPSKPSRLYCHCGQLLCSKPRDSPHGC